MKTTSPPDVVKMPVIIKGYYHYKYDEDVWKSYVNKNKCADYVQNKLENF